MASCSDPAFAQLSGRIGDLVYCRRGKGSYVRVYVKPTNPNSERQQAKRARFKQAVAAWRALSPEQQQAFALRAKPLGRTGYHLFLSEFMTGSPTP